MSQGPITLLRNMIRLLVARHGQSEWNATGRWQGRADPPLSELGMAQARAAAALVGAVDAVLASPLERALVTATMISESIGVGPVMVEPGLLERHAGEFQGLTRQEIDTQFPGYLESGERPPGWEPDREVTARALSALDAIAEMASTDDHLNGENLAGTDDPSGGERLAGGASGASDILAISHAGIIYSLEANFGEAFQRIDNLNGRWFVHNGRRWSLGDRMSLIPDGAMATGSESM